MLLVAALFVVSACNVEDGRTEVTFMHWGSQAEVEANRETAGVYNAMQDRVTVRTMHTPWETYIERLNTMAMAGNLPDTGMMSEPAVIRFAQEGLLMNVDAMYGPDDARPMDSLAFTYEGQTVAYSNGRVFILLFYDKDKFDAAGVPYPPNTPEAAWTWDEFIEVGKQLTFDANGNTPNDAGFDSNSIVQYGLLVENLPWQLNLWALSNGGRFFSEDGKEVLIDSPEAIEAIQKVADLHLVHNVAPFSGGLTDNSMERSIIAGTVAMATGGNWNVAFALKGPKEEGLNYGFAVLPYMKEKVTLNNAGPVVVFSQTKNPQEAMEFVKWFTNPEQNWTPYGDGVLTPSTMDWFTEEDKIERWLGNRDVYPPMEEVRGVYIDWGATYSQPATSYYTPNVDAFEPLLAQILGDVWTGRITAEEAIKNNIDALKAAHAGN